MYALSTFYSTVLDSSSFYKTKIERVRVLLENSHIRRPIDFIHVDFTRDAVYNSMNDIPCYLHYQFTRVINQLLGKIQLTVLYYLSLFPINFKTDTLTREEKRSLNLRYHS